MSPLNLSISVPAGSVQCICFAPFFTDGYGGFALCLIEEQEQIPLDPPFSKGEKKAHPVATSFSGVGESCMQVAA